MDNMSRSPVRQAVRKYFSTTTLHGFKYLTSPYWSDRIWWVVCCIASASCAGVLCNLLWERFVNLPALLTGRDVSDDPAEIQYIPFIAVCQPPEAVAHHFLHHLATKEANKTRLAATFGNALRGTPTNDTELNYLENLFRLNHTILVQVLYKYTPDCRKLIRKCRWQGIFIPCGPIFRKTYTREGVCCVANPDKITSISLPPKVRLDVSKKFEMVLDCFNASVSRHGCEFFTKYQGEEWILPRYLKQGYHYMGHLTFAFEEDTGDNLLDDWCVPTKGYSEHQCLMSCVEKQCGCSDPLKLITLNNSPENYLPPCRLKKISCIRTLGLNGNSTCKRNCLPPCKKVITKMVLDESLINMGFSIDPLYSDINISGTSIIRLKINIFNSKVFSLLPTETWFSLLSSLGGVFNMFLGVGLFSAIEFLYFLIFKLPAALI